MRPAALFSVAVAALASLAQADRHSKRPKEIKEGCWYECDDRCYGKSWTLLDLSKFKNCMAWCLQHNAMSRLDDCVHLNAIGGGLLG
ncbi:hypothetical protein RB213_015269 [Colletotrichum asianum]